MSNWTTFYGWFYTQALSFLLRELEGLPGSLLRQHWLTIRKEQDPMTSMMTIEGGPLQVLEAVPLFATVEKQG